MINLLPPEEKIALIREEQLKLVLILGIVFLSALLSLILILFSIKIYISGQTNSEKIIFNQEEKKFKSAEFQKLQEEIILTNKTLSDLNSFYQNQINFTEILEKISGILPSGVYLTTLSLSSSGSGILDCSVSGFAPTREVLLDFKDNLESIEIFKEFYFPLTNLVKSTNIDFNLSFKITR